jgi:copper(I)-binding protein
MSKRVLLALAAATLLHAGAAWAIGVVTVSQPWVRPAPLGGTTTLSLVLGSSTDVTLVGACTSAGEVALMHGKSAAATIDAAAGQPLRLDVRGAHLVLRRLSRPLALGDHVAVTLTLRDAQGRTQDIPVDAEVRRRSPIDDERRAHGGTHVH